MGFEIEMRDGSNILTLEGRIGIDDAPELKEKAVALSESADEAIIDATNLESLDTSIIQLLIAFAQSLKSVSLIDESEFLYNAMIRWGLNPDVLSTN